MSLKEKLVDKIRNTTVNLYFAFLASPQIACVQPSNRTEPLLPSFLSGGGHPQYPDSKLCTYKAMVTGKKTSHSFRLTGCGLSFLLSAQSTTSEGQSRATECVRSEGRDIQPTATP